MTEDKYIQIDKGHCGGDRTLFEEIKEALYNSGKFRVTEDTMIFTIIKKPEEIPKEKLEVEAEKQIDNGLKDTNAERVSHVKFEGGVSNGNSTRNNKSDKTETKPK